jgi:hypothetical protein
MPVIAERLPAKYLVKEEAPKIISSPQQHEAYISRLLDLQREAHRTAEETETVKLLVVPIADYEAKHFIIAKASGVENGLTTAKAMALLGEAMARTFSFTIPLSLAMATALYRNEIWSSLKSSRVRRLRKPPMFKKSMDEYRTAESFTVYDSIRP